MALNAKQQLFIAQYVLLKDATAAAKAAGYSSATAHSQGHRLLSHAEVKAALTSALDVEKDRLRRAAAARGFTKERWLRELEIIAGTNMDDYVQIVKTESTKNEEIFEDGEFKSVRVPDVRIHVDMVPTKARPRYQGRAIKKISESKNGLSVELHSKQAALDTLGRHYGWLKDQVEMSGPGGGPQVILTMPANGTEAITTPILAPPPIPPKDEGNGGS